VLDGNGYIISIGKGNGDEVITQEEYETILAVIENRPVADFGYVYKLRTDLTWEKMEVPVVEFEEEISDTEALAIILGGDVL
jgi:hypothetical protein